MVDPLRDQHAGPSCKSLSRTNQTVMAAAWNPVRDPRARERKDRPTHWLRRNQCRWRRRLPPRGVVAVGPPAASSPLAPQGALSALESRRRLRSRALPLPPSDLQPHRAVSAGLCDHTRCGRPVPQVLQLKSQLKSPSLRSNTHTTTLFSMPEGDLGCPDTEFGKGRMPKLSGCCATSGRGSQYASQHAFWLFCPTVICTAEDTSHRLRPPKSIGDTTGLLISEITCICPN